jgi:ribA/ribD-fused uncharacterized protein
VVQVTAFKGRYAFLSNFYPATVVFDGITYPSVEPAYQAAKSCDNSIRRKFAKMTSPVEAKREGRKLKVDMKAWERRRLEIMTGLVRDKFTRHRDLGLRLVKTHPMELIEGNWWGDKFWGVCQGEGQNHLGKILMRIRDELRAEEKG